MAEEEVVWVEQLVVVDVVGEGGGEHAAKADDPVGYSVAFLGLAEADELVHQLVFRVVEVPGLWEMVSAVEAEALALPYFHQNQR